MFNFLMCSNSLTFRALPGEIKMFFHCFLETRVSHISLVFIDVHTEWHICIIYTVEGLCWYMMAYIKLVTLGCWSLGAIIILLMCIHGQMCHLVLLQGLFLALTPSLVIKGCW